MSAAAIDIAPCIWALGKTRAYQSSELVKRVLTVIDIVAGGIHNAPVAFDRLDHEANETVQFVWAQPLANSQPDTLTRLLLFAQPHGLRVEIIPHSSRAVMLKFSVHMGPGGVPARPPSLINTASRWGLLNEVRNDN